MRCEGNSSTRRRCAAPDPGPRIKSGEVRGGPERSGASLRLVVADRFSPSSKTCSACGHVVDRLPLGIRAWCCPTCAAHHDRDANAARNLELLVGMARPEPLGHDTPATRGEHALGLDPRDGSSGRFREERGEHALGLDPRDCRLRTAN
ncbi:MAG: zinc ribbon domain-containing protein [Hyphomicrobiaceae bacterium]